MINIDEKLSKKKAAGYIRVSTVYQVDKDSLPMQREDLTNYIKYALGINEYEIFEDAGYSAKNTDRPSFQRMMSRLRSGEFSHLVVWKIDRISRNLIDFTTMYEELKRLGVTFVSKNEQFDTSSAMGEAMLKIILVFAELERKMTSERVSAVMVSRANEGKYNGGRIPIGYNYDKSTKTISVNDAEAKIVNLIYDKYDEMQSIIQVVKYLNSQGVKTKRGYDFSATTVHKVLTNKFYVGDLVYNKHDERNTGNSSTKSVRDESEWIVIEDHHPAIIERWRQERTIAALSSRNFANVSYKTYQRRNTHIFAGLIQCGMCGKGMTASVDKERSDGYRPSIYICDSRRKTKLCSNKYVSDITLGPFIFNLISNIVKAYNNVGKSTSVEMLEKKLLRGDTFNNVYSIEREGVRQLLDSIRNASNDSTENIILSKSTNAFSASTEEKDLLRSEKKRHEAALSRLQQLFLYGEDAITQTDYLVQKTNIEKSIDIIDKRLNEIDSSIANNFVMTDSDFFSKASMFIIQSNLAQARSVDFDKLIRTVDKQTLKMFINKVVQKVVVLDGKIAQISFQNGISLKFLYAAK